MGLLDNLNDPQQQAILTMAMGLLGGKSARFGQNLSNAGMAGLGAYNAATLRQAKLAEEEQQKKLREFAINNAQKQQNYDQAFQLTPGVAPTQTFGPNDMETPSQFTPGRNPSINFDALSRIDAKRALQDQAAIASLNAKQRQTFKPGETVGEWQPDGTFKPVFTAPDKPKESWRPLTPQEALDRGVPKNGQGYQINDRGEVKAFGSGPQTVVDVKYGNSFASALGGKTAELLDTGRAQAQAGADSIQTARGIREAIDSNKAFTGPGANVRLKIAQIAPMIGFQGDPEGVQKTREVIVGLSKQALAARGALKGQGRISDFEGKLLERASAGNVEDLTASEIRTILDVNERAARMQIRNHNRVVESALKKPEFSDQRDIYKINEPPAYSPKQPSTGGGFTYLGTEGK